MISDDVTTSVSSTRQGLSMFKFQNHVKFAYVVWRQVEEEEKINKIELKCLLGQTRSFRVNFWFNQIIIDDVTIIQRGFRSAARKPKNRKKQ